MPEYTFRCGLCNRRYREHWRRQDYDANISVAKCPRCGSRHVDREYGEDLPDINYIAGEHEVTTVGQLAERNNKKYGKEKVAQMQREQRNYG